MSIRKRTWATQDGPSIAWVVDYTVNGKRHHKTFKTQKAAKAWWEGRASYEVRQGTHTPDSVSITVEEAAQLWLQACRTGSEDREPLERATIREYENHVEQYITSSEFGIGDVKLSQLQYATVRAFLERLREAGKSPAMVRKIRGSLSALISDAMERALVSRHAIRDGSKRRARSRKPREAREVKLLTKDELRAMLSEASGTFRPLFMTAVFTGLRASELRGLTWDNVDLKAGVIHVRQRADRWNEMGPPKSASGNRSIPLAPIVVNTLKEWKLKCPKSDLGLVFPTSKGKVQSLSNIYKRGFAPLQVKCGMAIDTGKIDKDGKPILRARHGFHVLRHTAASLFIEQGFTPKKVQSLLGHSSIQMTFDTYGKLFPTPDDDRAAMAQVQARIVGAA